MIGMVYNMVMEYENFRLYRGTVEKLRTIYGFTGVKMIAIVDDLVIKELERQEGERARVRHEEGQEKQRMTTPATTE